MASKGDRLIMKDFDGSVAMKKIERSYKIRVFFFIRSGGGGGGGGVIQQPVSSPPPINR